MLLVDGWAALRREHQDLDFEIEALLDSGLTYGIHVVVAASRWAEMRPSVADALGSRIELRLGDPLESEVDRRRAERLPAGVPGRGLTVAGEELQVALPRLDGLSDTGDLGAALEAAAAEIAARWDGPAAPPVHVLPARLTADALPDGGAGIVIGIDEARAAPVAVELSGPDPHLLILGDAESGRTNLLRHVVGQLDGDVLVADPRRTLADVAGAVRRHAASAAEIGEVAAEVAAEIRRRVDAGGGEPLFLVVDDYDLLAGPAGNPLAPLVGLLAQGRDVDVHVVLARRVAGTTRAAFEPVFQQLIELRSPTLILSGDPGEGPLVDGVRAQPLPPGRAMLVRRGHRPELIQTVLAPPRDAAGALTTPETTA
jgi:S-DNA-T family DNA segregation ATPase FtsK/SpoIIIE